MFPKNKCRCPECGLEWVGFALADEEGMPRDEKNRVVVQCGGCFQRLERLRHSMHSIRSAP